MEDNRRLMCIPKRIHSKVMEVFQVYSDSIVDILEDSTFKEYEILMQDLELDLPFGSDMWDFFKEHERTLAVFTKRYLEIQELGGDTEKVVLLRNNQIIKYINGLRKKKIGMVKDESILDSHDKAYWDRQNLFKEIIEENILKYYQTSKGDYYYTTVDDVLNFFSGENGSKSIHGKELYNNFLNGNGKFDFTLSTESVGKYMNSIEKFFHKKRIRYDGNRLNIYCMVN